MNAGRLVMLLTMAVALAGCGLLRGIETGKTEPWVKPGMSRPANDLESLLLYFDHIKELPASDLGSERDDARRAFTQNQSDFNRIRLAMVLSLPDTGLKDTPRALDLLDPMVRSEDSSLRGLALLLNAYLQERRRLEGSVQSLQQNVQGLQQNVRGLQQKIDALKLVEKSLSEREQSLQQNVDGLQQKLDALKSLDKSLIERERGAPKRKR